MQINLLSPATNVNISSTNDVNKKLLTFAVITWVIIIGICLILFVLNILADKKVSSIEAELVIKNSQTEKLNKERQLENELNQKTYIIQSLDSQKLIYSKVLNEINTLLPYQVTISKFEIVQGSDVNHYSINLEGEAPDLKTLAKFQSTLQAFGNANYDNTEKFKYADSRITSSEQTQDGKRSYKITISIKKEVIAND